MQSPKSKRGKAPCESTPSDNNPTEKSGGTHAERHGSEQARSKAHVPKHSATGHSGAGRGYTPQYGATVPAHTPTPSQAGRAGYQTCNPCGSQRGKR